MRQSNLRRVLSGALLVRSLWVAIIVGTLLNLINQPEAIFGAGAIHWPKLLLTYCVPFLVSTYGAYGAMTQDS